MNLTNATEIPARRKSRVGQLFRGILVGYLLGILAIAGLKVARVYPHARSLAAQAASLRSWAVGLDANLADAQARVVLRKSLDVVRGDVRYMRDEALPLLRVLSHLGWVPDIGSLLGSSRSILDAAVEVADGAAAAMNGMEPAFLLYDSAGSSPSAVYTEELLARLDSAQPQLAEAEAALSRADALLEPVPTHRLPQSMAGAVGRLQVYLPTVRSALVLLKQAPALLGADHPASYLVLAQNDHELRPTGGFLSGVGVLVLEHGQVTEARIVDSYAADADCTYGLHAPDPLREYMWASQLKLRDANWSPDFPSSAAVIRSLYRQCVGEDVAGVVAIDMVGVGQLLDVLGPLQPEGYAAPVSRASLEEFVAQYWSDPLRSGTMTDNPGDWWVHRKDFMADLLSAMVDRMATPSSVSPGRLARAVLSLVQEKHVLLILDEPLARHALASAGWDGALQDSRQDSLLVVDTNVGFRKVNPYIQQSMDYHLAFDADSTVQATLVIEYGNTSAGSGNCVAGARYDATYAEMMKGCYWDYVRVYVPWGSHLLDAQGGDSAASVSEEEGHTVFGMLVIVPPGHSRRLSFTYDVATDVPNDLSYELLLGKQAGTGAIPVRISVRPAGRPILTQGCTATVDDASGGLELLLSQECRVVLDASTPEQNKESYAYALLGPGLLFVVVAYLLGMPVAKEGSH